MDKKEIVINTARELFSKYGYTKVSMDEIARVSKVTKRTIYSYFKDKESLFLYFIEEELKQMRTNIEKKRSKEKPFIEVVTANLYDMLKFKNNSSLVSTISKEIKSGNMKNQEFLKVYDKEILDYLEEKIDEEIKLGRIKSCDSHLTAFIIYKVFISVLFEYDLEIDEEKVAKEVSTVLKDGLLN